jgi:DNA-binding MarR family transcriptional regulator
VGTQWIQSAGDWTATSVKGGLNIDRYFNSITGFEALRPEAKLLFHLGSRGDLSVKEAMFVSGLSYRGFYMVLGRLVDSGFVEIHQDGRDKRVRRISLAQSSTAQQRSDDT